MTCLKSATLDIIFNNRKLEKQANNSRLLEKKQGTRRANLIRRRLDDLAAAATLEDMDYFPQARCHALSANREGQFSVDLDHPYRLIFIIANDPIPRVEDGGVNRLEVTAICIIGVEDTHE